MHFFRKQVSHNDHHSCGFHCHLYELRSSLIGVQLLAASQRPQKVAPVEVLVEPAWPSSLTSPLSPLTYAIVIAVAATTTTD